MVQNEKNIWITKNLESNEDLTDKLKFNVGGEIIETPQKLIMKFPNSNLSKIVAENYMIDSSIYLNRDPKCFKNMLEYLKNN